MEEHKGSLFFNHSNCSHYILWSNVSVFAIERMVVIHYLKCTVPFSFAVSLAATRCHSWSFVVIRCYLSSLFSFVVPLAAIYCYSLLFVALRCNTRCHSLSLDVPLVCFFINDRNNFPFLRFFCFYIRKTKQKLT